MKYSDFDKRMKENYENRSKTFLTRRIPVIVRVDGKAFHTFCKRFVKPYDQFLNNALATVLKHLCENIQGAKIGERHSDELSILLTDYETLQTDAYFNYNTQKISSVVASMATAEFCRILAMTSFKTRHHGDWIEKEHISWDEKWPTFDARCFNIPKEEVANYFWWRMQDAKRNSVSMQAQSKFSHKELQGKNSNQMQEMLWQTHNINWDNLPQRQKIGDLCLKTKVQKIIEQGPDEGQLAERNVWVIEGSPKARSELGEIIDPLVNQHEE
jgi:tRNA(His) guanylyltransferase